MFCMVIIAMVLVILYSKRCVKGSVEDIMV